MKEIVRPRFPREKWGFLFLTLGALFLAATPVLGDSPIYQGFFWDAAPAAAYNSQRGEFLVVWNEFNPFTPLPDIHFFGPVKGQLIKENGQLIGPPFEIIPSGGVQPKVAYNAQTNEYLVVAERYYNIVGQRVSAIGLKIGGLITYLANTGRSPRVLYNSLAGNYLVAGVWWSDTPSCTIVIGTVQVSAAGQPMGAPTMVANEGYSSCGDNAGLYALEYAPISSTKAPQGRYLLAIAGPGNLKLLNSQGRVLQALYDPAHGTWVGENILFESSKVGTPYNIDIGYGLENNGQPVFFLVWGDIGQYVDNYGQWTGIWGGIVDAEKELYYTTDPVSNEVFPISYQWSHVTYPDIYKQWKPVVKYNNSAGTFVVAWRETPGTDPQDLTNVNHIRVNTSDGYRIPPLANLVVSSTTGAENPVLPTLASSTRTAKVLIAWEDYRSILGDIYGTFFDPATRSTSPIIPGGGGGLPLYWKSVSAGWGHTLGIRSDGSLWAWGNNRYGELGTGNTDDQHSPVQVVPGSTWAQVSAGWDHTLGIRSDGSLWAWGFNYHGELGTGNTDEQHSPVQVVPGSTWAQVSAGLQETLGIRSDVSLWAWGWNGYGALGIGNTDEQHRPVQVVSGSTWAQVSSGGLHTLGIRSDGSLWAWGWNGYGALGIGNTDEQHSPVQVVPGSTWAQVSAGEVETLGIRSDGSLWAWGRNGDGQLGTGNTDEQHSPVQVVPGSTWAQVSSGSHHTLGIRSDGSLWAWGNNRFGELGTGNTDEQHRPVPVENETDWVSISAGYGHFSLGLRSDGCLYAWGLNDLGQLGLGDTQDRHVPTLVPMSCSSPNLPGRLWLPLILRQ